MAADDKERTEQPTSRRRDEARAEGNVATSKEIGTFFVILGGLVALSFFGVWMAGRMMEFMRWTFALPEGLMEELSAGGLVLVFRQTSYLLLVVSLPVLFIPVFGAFSYILQNGFMLTGKPLAPDLAKLDPVKGLKKIFSVNAVAELVKSVLKVSVLTYVVADAVFEEWRNLPMLLDMEVVRSSAYTARAALNIMARTVWVLAVIAVLDYLFQRWNHERGLRMTKEEIKEEMKETEGDPLIKARVRSIQREMARKRMMQDVPDADVVVTNPTHLAVALKYDRDEARAPYVVAKGAGFIAERIIEIARGNGVPVIENRPLARSIYKMVDVGSEIPVGLYKAVAELLAYVYRLRSKVEDRT